MSGERAPNDPVQPDEHTDPRLDLGIVIALLGGGPTSDSTHADAAAPAGDEIPVDTLDRP